VTDPTLHVVATAGHVDHGKSSLIVRLTGIDPDRWEEEKRRGLTIDLGFAWTTLPSGREIGFVDVPGHERFVRNMLAGVGPVRLVLFVVAADEGWKPQSEEHLAIVDVLGAHGGVIALTKSDLATEDELERRRAEIADRVAGTVLEKAAVVACSSTTGAGVEELRAALDDLVGMAPPPEDAGRPRIHIDRSFTIKGAGTVVTGTLIGGSLTVEDEVELYPSGLRARIRSLQTHRRPVGVARPVSRVAANLAGTAREAAARGDVLGRVGQWRPTTSLEVQLSPVRGASPLTVRGAYKIHVGAAERDVQLRLYGRDALEQGGTAFARLRLAHPVTVAVGDRFVLRDTGRRTTVAGGLVVDTEPPRRPGPAPEERLARRVDASPERLASLLVEERGAVRVSDLTPVTGVSPHAMESARRIGAWWVARASQEAMAEAVTHALAEHHRAHPLRPGMEAAEARAALHGAAPSLSPALEAGLAGAVLARLEEEGRVARHGTMLRLPGHRVTLGADQPEADRLVDRVRSEEPTPPGVELLVEEGFTRELIEAAVSTGLLVRVSDGLVVTPELAARAEETARREGAAPQGLTVSRFRELLGTTRKYALPLLELMDRSGITRRDGDVRRLR
jgi:selenocysteine-specific elongation factor